MVGSAVILTKSLGHRWRKLGLYGWIAALYWGAPVVRYASIAYAVVALAGCQTASQEPDFQTRYRPYVSFPLSVFISRTGRVPSDYADLGPGKRMFTFLGDTVTMSVPAYGFVPAVSNTQTCRVSIETTRVGATGTPEDFRIVGFNGIGPCANF